MLERGRPSEAFPLLERAVAIDEKHEGVQENELSHRFNLARPSAPRPLARGYQDTLSTRPEPSRYRQGVAVQPQQGQDRGVAT